jgi:PAS domain S-box-containing protein
VPSREEYPAAPAAEPASSGPVAGAPAPSPRSTDVGRLIRAALLMLVLLATGVGAASWERLREASGNLALLPVLLVLVICAFVAMVYLKTREVTELKSAVQGLHQRHTVLTSEVEAQKLLQTVTASREAFRDLIDSFDAAVFTLSLDGKIRAANKAFTLAVQRSFAEVVGRSLSEFVSEPSLESLQAALPVFIEKRQWSGLVRAYVAPRGQWRYFDCTLHPVLQDGSVLAVTVIANDVTAERERETLYTALFEALSEPVWVATSEGRLLDLNNSFVAMLGAASKQELVGQNILELLLEPGRSVLAEALRRRQPVRDLEVTVARSEGLPAVCLANAVPVTEVSGSVRYNGTFTDVTDRRAMERRLAREQKFREQLIASFPDAIVTLDGAGRFTFVSGRAERLFGAPAEALLATPIAQQFDEQDGDAFLGLLQDCTTIPDTVCSREVHLNPSSHTGWRTIQVRVTALQDDEQKVLGVVASLRDVTEQRRLEQELIARERLAAVGQMIDGFAHELNNPLTAILGACDLMAEEGVPPQARRNLELMQSQSARAREIVQNLMLFARPSAEGMVIIDIQDLVGKTISLRRHSLRAKDILVDFTRGPEPATVMGDPGQLMQVFVNLLVNAEEATMAGRRSGGTVRIRAGVQQNAVWCTFQDDGPGIAPELADRIFEPFFTTKRPGSSVGLGLSICRSILEAHAGRIEVLPAAEGGAVFRVSLPQATRANRSAPRKSDTAFD